MEVITSTEEFEQAMEGGGDGGHDSSLRRPISSG